LILESTRIRFVESGGVQLVNNILFITGLKAVLNVFTFFITHFEGKHHGIVERALGVLVAASLRNVHLTEVMVHEQHFDTLFDLMRKHKDEGGIQRQCCMLIRNCAASGAQTVKVRRTCREILYIVLRWQNSPCSLSKELKIYFDWRKRSTYCYVQMLVAQLCVISVARTTMKNGIRVLWFSVLAEES